MQTKFFPAGKRGFFDHGWLVTYHSFSFANFYDPDLMGFGKLRVVNDDTIAPSAGFGEHPHADMEIITIPLSGAVAHRDNTGGQGIVGPGEVQVMSAGTGVRHSEYNPSGTEPLALFQIWIEPDTPHLPPRYDQKRFGPGKSGKFQLLVSPFSEEKNSASPGELHIHQKAFVSLGHFSAGETIDYSLHSGNQGVFLMTVEGELRIGGRSIGRRDAVGLSETENISGLMTRGGELLLIEIPLE